MKPRTRTARELMRCEVVRAEIDGARGRASFSARVSRLLGLGYEPLGSPHYDGNTATLTLTKIQAP